jgi:hypothetical protein
MQRKQATVGCFWLDELEHAECVHPSSPLLFRNEREALDTLGTNCAILRVLRRTFVAVRIQALLFLVCRITPYYVLGPQRYGAPLRDRGARAMRRPRRLAGPVGGRGQPRGRARAPAPRRDRD